MAKKAERGQLFSLDVDYDENSTKQDGIAWGRWRIFILAAVERHISDEQEARDRFHAYGKLQFSYDYERNLSAVEVASKILSQDEKPMATLIREA